MAELSQSPQSASCSSGEGTETGTSHPPDCGEEISDTVSERRCSRQVGPTLSRTASSADEPPPSFFVRATNYISSSAGVATGMIGGGVPGFGASAPQAIGMGSRRSAMWQWMTGGGGATISSTRYVEGEGDEEENTADAPVTLSLPSRGATEEERRISVRVESNPRVDLLLVTSNSSSASLGPASPRQIVLKEQTLKGAQGDPRFSLFTSENFENADDVGVEISDQARRLSAIKTFVSIHASASCQPSSDRKDCRAQVTAESAEMKGLPFAPEDTTVEELSLMLRECACQRRGSWSLADISDLISEALQFDFSRGSSNAGDKVTPSQSARVLIFFQSLLLRKEGLDDIPTFIEAGIEALLAGWTEEEAGPGAKGSEGQEGELYFLYARFIQSKASFLSTRMDIFEGDFSFSGFLRRLDIESADSERHCKNKRARSQLFSGEAMRAIAELITELSEVLLAMLAQTTEIRDPGSRRETPGDAAKDESSARSSLDAASRELALYVLTLEAFCACSAIEKLAQDHRCRADLTVSQKSVFKIVEVCQMVTRFNDNVRSLATHDEDARTPLQQETLLSKALLPAADGIYRFDEYGVELFGGKKTISFSPSMDRNIRTESLATQEIFARNTEIQDLKGEEHTISDEKPLPGIRVSDTQQPCQTREIDCTFTTVAALHSAFSREIRGVADRGSVK